MCVLKSLIIHIHFGPLFPFNYIQKLIEGKCLLLLLFLSVFFSLQSKCQGWKHFKFGLCFYQQNYETRAFFLQHNSKLLIEVYILQF